jgi:predicted RNase H-like nuclease
VPAFIGLDLAWTPHHESGVCILEGQDGGNMRLVRLDCVIDTPGAFAALCHGLGSDVVAAIDAPLILSPRRRAESELARVFGKYRAGAYSPNLPFLMKMNGLAGPQLACSLAECGFEFDPARLRTGAHGRFALEVFPHPAHVALFGLQHRLAYKKGTLAERRVALIDYQRHLAALLARELPLVLESPLAESILAPDSVNVPGRAMKHIEDRLDALTCAYVAYHCWNHGPNGFRVFGCAEHGCIVVPNAASGAGTMPARG